MSIQTLANEAYNAMEHKQRGNETITTLKDAAPEWVRNLVYTVHGDMLPDDWLYKVIRSALKAIADCESDDDLNDLGYEWADAEVDIYTGDRLKWLASNFSRADYCDQAKDEFGNTVEGIIALIGAGQLMEAREVWIIVTDALRKRAEELKT